MISARAFEQNRALYTLEPGTEWPVLVGERSSVADDMAQQRISMTCGGT